MRRSLIILFTFFTLISLAQNKKGERVTIRAVDLDLENIFDSLSNQTGYFFSYNSELLPAGNKFTITAEDVPVDQFLSRLLVGTNLKYTFFKEQIIINYEKPEPEIKKKKTFSVSGNVTDENGQPLYGVNVFLDGTTIGSATDTEGNFSIDNISPGYYSLVFSYIGYENAVYNISEYNGGSRIQKHQMVPDLQQLQEIEIVSNRITSEFDEWMTYYKQFQNDFFGTSENSWHCVITNPEVIDFTYDDAKSKLTAHASEPLNIINEAMAYRITYYLESFERTENDLRYRGQIRFQDDYRLKGFTKREIKKERKKGYLGSWNHFKKSLLASRLRKDGFRVYESRTLDARNLSKLKELSEGDLVTFKGNHWELDFNNYLLVVYSKELESVNFLIDGQFASVIYGDYLDESSKVVNRAPGKQISMVKLLKGPVRIDLNGQVIDRFAISSFGYWSWERLANLVPINYDP